MIKDAAVRGVKLMLTKDENERNGQIVNEHRANNVNTKKADLTNQ